MRRIQNITEKISCNFSKNRHRERMDSHWSNKLASMIEPKSTELYNFKESLSWKESLIHKILYGI